MNKKFKRKNQIRIKGKDDDDILLSNRVLKINISTFREYFIYQSANEVYKH